MRKTRFRGISKETGKMIYGSLVTHGDKSYITWGAVADFMGIVFYNDRAALTEVKSETVGQHTGLKDMHGKEIYEGDIMATNNNHKGVVTYDECQYILASKEGEYEHDMFYKVKNHGATVIGNIHENPELLK